MPSDESAAVGSYTRGPKYRSDCIDWYHEPSETSVIQFRGPEEVFCEIEHAAQQADRTFNAQLKYLLKVCRGEQALAFDDGRTVAEWQSLLSQMEIQFGNREDWIPCSALYQIPQTHGA